MKMLSVRSLLSVFAGLALVYGCSDKPVGIVWVEGENNPESGLAQNTILVANPPKGNNWTVWFADNYLDPVILPGSQGTIFHLNGCLYGIRPTADYGDTLRVLYAASALPRKCWAPEGFSLLRKGEEPVQIDPKRVEYRFLPCAKVYDPSYDSVSLCVTDMIPSLKKVVLSEGDARISSGLLFPENAEISFVPGHVPGWYRIKLDKQVFKMEVSDEDALFYASTTLENIRRNALGESIPALVIEDWPDMQYRGYMLDVARNFTSRDNVLKLLDVLSHYKVNVFHLHFADDEGWRLEIDGIPELTSFGSRHALPVFHEDGSFDEIEGLMPSFDGNIDPENAYSTANGYYTKDDFITILHYAWERRIKVIPEFDIPGHSRAAIKSMEAYAKRTSDNSMLLSEIADTSVYLSKQYYKDNAINVALPSTYNFIAKIFDTLIAYYREAGVPLAQIHIGGDEVPGGAWTGSPACRQLLASTCWPDADMKDSYKLKSYFTNKVLDIARARGVKVCGWQETFQHLDSATAARLRENCSWINVWDTRERRHKDELTYKCANLGFKTVVSSMSNSYLDLASNRGKDERGLSWGGFVNERKVFSLLPFDIYRSLRWDDDDNPRDISTAGEGKTALECPSNIIGVQAQLWGETIRNFSHVSSYSFPKALGLFERGWNAHPAWESSRSAADHAFLSDYNKFFSIVSQREFPYFDSLEIIYRKPILTD